MNRVKLESRRQDVDADGQWGEVHEVHEGHKEGEDCAHFLPGWRKEIYCLIRSVFSILGYKSK